MSTGVLSSPREDGPVPLAALDIDTPTSPVAGRPVSRDDAERLAGVLKALADPTRLRLLSLVQSAPDSEACVCELTESLGLSQPTVSHHLRVLWEAGLLRRQKRGVWSYYRLVPNTLVRVADLLTPPRDHARH